MTAPAIAGYERRLGPLRWTTKSTRKLAGELSAAGHPVSDFVVRRLLRELGFSLRANAKTIEGGQHPDRDAQFGYLNGQAAEHLASDDPVISVDTKTGAIRTDVAQRLGGLLWGSEEGK